MIRILLPGEEAQVEAFLRTRADTSLLLLSNLQSAGLHDRGEPLHATWAGAFDGGELTGIAAHTWLSTAVLQAPREGEGAALVRAAAKACGRPLKGLIGPWAQAVAAREGLGLLGAETTLAEPDILFTLSLSTLRVPEALASGRVQCRRARDEDLETMIRFRMAYCVECNLEPDTPALRGHAERTVGLAHRRGNLFVLTEAGRPVATTAFNARVADAGGKPWVVQIGGVWTPPELRGRGYARCAVAGQLLEARGEGANRAVLFTGRSQLAAQATYRALGFTEGGDYGMILFRDPPRL